MADNEFISERIETYLETQDVAFEIKKMFGGNCFMVDGKMCVGTTKTDSLMVRLDPEIYVEVLQKEGCREMDFTGRPMKGFVFVDADVLVDDKEIGYWIGLALEYNPKAKSSRKKKR